LPNFFTPPPPPPQKKKEETHLHRFVRGDASLALTEELLNKLGDAATGNGDVLDGRTNDVAFSDGDDVGHTITRVDDSTGESALGNLNLNY